jgi:predicted nucleotidyltransferase
MKYPIGLLYEIDASRKERLEKERHEILEQTIIETKNVFKNLQVQEVFLTGSILIPYKFSSRSDIDIAVKGLSAHDYFPVLSKLEESLLRTVEIIELENCRFSDKIITTGLRVL